MPGMRHYVLVDDPLFLVLETLAIRYNTSLSGVGEALIMAGLRVLRDEDEQVIGNTLKDGQRRIRQTQRLLERL